MTGTDRVRLRETFNQAAELYYRARPGYPPALFDELAAVAGLGPGCRVLEIGCGTGQATVPLAERGCEIVAVELGADLATVARRNLARFPRVEVVVAAFEDWPLPTEPFDTVVAATAWHWLAPAVRVAKAAQALRPGRALATISTHHIAGGNEAFFVEAHDSAQGIREGTVFRTLLDYGATMAELRIDDLRREAARERLAQGPARWRSRLSG